MLFVLTGTAAAQRVSAGYAGQRWSRGPLNDLDGVQLGFRPPSGPELSLEVGAGRWRTNGTLCSGLIPDASICPVESLRASGTSIALSMVARMLAVRGSFGEMSVGPSVGFGLTRLRLSGEGSGGEAEDSMLRLEGGVAARYRTPPVWRAVGAFIELRGSYGLSLTGTCVDCRPSIDGDALRRSLLAGVTIGR